MTDDVRQQILATATALFAEKGFAKTSMNDIVRASGLSKGGVYWHFASKDDIITAIVDQFFEVQLAAFTAVLARDDLSASEKLMSLAQFGGDDTEALLEQFPSSLEFYALAARDDRLRERLLHYFRSYRGYMRRLIEQGIAAGEWADHDADATADTVIALFEGVVLVYSLMPDAYHPGEQLEKSMTLLLAGLQQR